MLNIFDSSVLSHVASALGFSPKPHTSERDPMEGWGLSRVTDSPSHYVLTTIGSNTNAVKCLLNVAPKDFEGFRPKFDAVVDSYKAN